MATLWKLVELVWTTAPCAAGHKRLVFSEPDEISGIFELRRLSTNPDERGKRTDFFEYYWAHHMRDNTWEEGLAWLASLARRKKTEVPPRLQKAWSVLRLMAFVGAGLGVLLAGVTLFSSFSGHLMVVGILATALLAAVIALVVADRIFFSPVLGDAARYLRPNPNNIECRQKIKANGIALLEDLHKSGKYDRIIVVGHSLGGLIAYELVCHLWGRRNRAMDQDGPIQDALKAAEASAQALLSSPQSPEALGNWRTAQVSLFDAIRRQDQAQRPLGDRDLWLISDLITLGSPIAHADTIQADTPAQFQLMRERREVATNPPLLEGFNGEKRRFSYCRTEGLADDPDACPRAPHNAAAFAAVRWTNIYFPMQGVMRGDLIGGPAAGLFGPGVVDIAAMAPKRDGWFCHNSYFQLDDEGTWGDPAWVDHRTALRRAVALSDPALPVFVSPEAG